MGHLAGTENRVAGFEFHSSRTNFGNVLTFDNVEPLILIVVQMAWRATLLASSVPVLEEKERAGAVGGQNLRAVVLTPMV